MIKQIPDKCVTCKQCVKIFPFGAILLEGKTPILFDACTGCGACVDACRFEAIILSAKKSPGMKHLTPAGASGL